jgi:hypothetical protein
MPRSTYDDKTIERYRHVRALAERGSDGERDNARVLLDRMEREHPGIRAHVDLLEAHARVRESTGRRGAASQTDWSKVAEQAADFLGGVFRDIQREAEQQQARKNTSRKSVPDDDDADDDLDEEDDEIIDELFTITTSTTKAGKVTVKIEIDADGIETLLDTYEDEDDVWMILQSVGSRVAEELGDAILDEGDED